jgi:hypothetical protein
MGVPMICLLSRVALTVIGVRRDETQGGHLEVYQVRPDHSLALLPQIRASSWRYSSTLMK